MTSRRGCCSATTQPDWNAKTAMKTANTAGWERNAKKRSRIHGCVVLASFFYKHPKPSVNRNAAESDILMPESGGEWSAVAIRLGSRKTPPRENPRRRGGFVAGPSSVVGARKLLQGRIANVRSALPARATIQTEQMQVAVFPILGYSLTSDSISLVDLRDIALYQIRPALMRVEGVARVEITRGGRGGVSRPSPAGGDAKLPRVPPGDLDAGHPLHAHEGRTDLVRQCGGGRRD